MAEGICSLRPNAVTQERSPLCLLNQIQPLPCVNTDYPDQLVRCHELKKILNASLSRTLQRLCGNYVVASVLNQLALLILREFSSLLCPIALRITILWLPSLKW